MTEKIVSQDNVGRVFGRLTVLREFVKGWQRRWECLYSCGNVKFVRAYDVKKGNAQSCGCLQRERAHGAKSTHGQSKSAEYGVWQGMKNRVFNPKAECFMNYGGRGITIDPAWLDFSQFLADMGPRPSPEHSIERVDNDGPYSKDNCIWDTRAHQRRNNRFVRNYTLNGETLCMKDWAKKFGITYDSMRSRLEHGWTIERIAAAPQRYSKKVAKEPIHKSP